LKGLLVSWSWGVRALGVVSARARRGNAAAPVRGNHRGGKRDKGCTSPLTRRLHEEIWVNESPGKRQFKAAGEGREGEPVSLLQVTPTDVSGKCSASQVCGVPPICLHTVPVLGGRDSSGVFCLRQICSVVVGGRGSWRTTKHPQGREQEKGVIVQTLPWGKILGGGCYEKTQVEGGSPGRDRQAIGSSHKMNLQSRKSTRGEKKSPKVILSHHLERKPTKHEDDK